MRCVIIKRRTSLLALCAYMHICAQESTVASMQTVPSNQAHTHTSLDPLISTTTDISELVPAPLASPAPTPQTQSMQPVAQQPHTQNALQAPLTSPPTSGVQESSPVAQADQKEMGETKKREG